MKEGERRRGREREGEKEREREREKRMKTMGWKVSECKGRTKTKESGRMFKERGEGIQKVRKEVG